MDKERLSGKTWAILIAAVLALLALKAPPEADAALRIRTFVLNAFMFALAVPAIWHVTRMAFGRFAAAFTSIFFSILVLAPMWLVVGGKSQNITFGEDPRIFSLASVRWALIAFAALAYWLSRRVVPKEAGSAAADGIGETGGAAVNRARLRKTALLVLILLAIPQFLLRYGTYSPTGITAMDQDDSAIRPGSDGYFKLAYPTNDIQQHINPGGLFTGSEFDKSLSEGYSVCNDRPTFAYLYSAVGYYAHPYVGGRLLLFAFYVLIVVCAYHLARAGGAPHALSLAFAILLMSCEYLVTNANSLNVYIHVFGAQPILLYALYRSGFCRRDVSWREFAVYLAPLGFLSVGYYPFAYILFNALCFCALFILARRGGEGGGRFFATRKFALQALCALAAPAVFKAVWMWLLDFYGMLGDPGNRDVALYYSAHVKDMLLYAATNTVAFVRLLNASFLKLVVNYLEYEYWPVLGVLGLLGLLLAPRVARARATIPAYAMFLSFFLLSLVVGMVAELYPHPVWSENMPLTAARANGGYVIMVLGQAAAVYTLVLWALGAGAGRGMKTAKRRAAFGTLCFSLAAYAISFLPVAHAWAIHHAKYPLFPYGLGSFGW